jgi:hypothetical protein
MPTWIAVVALAVSLTPECHAATSLQIDAARNKGLKWLFERQAGDGSWRSLHGTEIPATASAIHTLATAQLKGPQFARAVSWLTNAQASSVDSLSRQIVALSLAGVNVAPYLTQIQALRNRTDRAVWGAYDHFGTSLPDTTLAISALRLGQVGSYLTNEVRYSFYCEILRAQLPLVNGKAAWPFTSPVGGSTTPPSQLVSGSILPTVYALLELHAFKSASGWSSVSCDAANQTPPGTQNLNSTHVDPAINAGVAWLLDKRNASNGGFGDEAPTTVTVIETALAYLAINTLQPSGTTTQRDAALDYLLQQQNSTDGSWGGGDAFLTAFVLSVFPSPATALTDTDKDGVPDAVEALMGRSTTVADRPAAGTGTGGGTQGLSSPGQALASFALTCGSSSPSSYQLPAPSGGTPPYTYSLIAGALPQGLSLNATSGQISGQTSVTGTFSATYRIADVHGMSISLPVLVQVSFVPEGRCLQPVLDLLLLDG